MEIMTESSLLSLYGDISPRVVRDFKVSLCDRDEQ